MSKRSKKMRAIRSHRERLGWHRKVKEVNNDIENCCPVTGKVIFLTELQAWKKARTTSFVPYQCPHCKLWHHTNAKGAK
jgi:hypothetical protein